jgi:hypothetical protein
MAIAAAMLAASSLRPAFALSSHQRPVAPAPVPPAAAVCAPRRLVHIVFRDVTPGIDPAAFGAKPRSLYRLGSDKLRSEEADDPAIHFHQLAVIAEPNIWTANLDTGAGTHAVDPGPSFNAHYPEFAGARVNPRLERLEFGCEADFIRDNALKPVRTKQVEGKSYDVYRLDADGDAVEILEAPGGSTPAFTRYFHAGKLALAWRYDLYELEPATDPSLFAPPPGVRFKEQPTR